MKPFKDVFLDILMRVLNMGSFKDTLNSKIKDIMSSSDQMVSGGLLSYLRQALPQNDIKINTNIHIDYAPVTDEPIVHSNRITGYFNGKMKNMGDQEINESNYTQQGNLDILDDDSQFTYQVSESLINDAFEVLLGKNVVSQTVTYNQFKSTGFPLDWTSTQLEGFITGIANSIGYDKPLMVKFLNRGAPRFVITSNVTSIIANMDMEMYLDGDSVSEERRVLTVGLDGLQIDFKVNIEKYQQQNIFIDWYDIKLLSSTLNIGPLLRSSGFTKDPSSHLDQVLSWFVWSFQFILPWVNKTHPANVSSFQIPTSFDTMAFTNFKLEIHDYFLSMSMNPVFTFTDHPVGQSRLSQHLLQLIQN